MTVILVTHVLDVIFNVFSKGGAAWTRIDFRNFVNFSAHRYICALDGFKTDFKLFLVDFGGFGLFLAVLGYFWLFLAVFLKIRRHHLLVHKIPFPLIYNTLL